jgi:nucleoside-diphosphate-sugar epimerase
VQRNLVHVEDLVSAILIAIDTPGARHQTFNICMDEPVDYGAVGKYLATTRGLPSVDIVTPYFSSGWKTPKRNLYSAGVRYMICPD